MIEKEYLIKVLISLFVVLALAYFTIPLFLKRRFFFPFLKLKGKGNIEVEDFISLGKDIFIVQLRISKKRLYVIITQNYSEVIHEESISDNSNRD